MFDDVVVIVDREGDTYNLTKLERHLLYCLEEDRPTSVRYNVSAVGNALAALFNLGLLYASPCQLTVSGLDVVARLRLRHEKPDDYITP